MTTLTGTLDANVIIGLAKGGVFELLAAVYTRLYIPPAVRQEIVGQGPGPAGEPELTRALGVWITEVVPDPQIVQQFSATLSTADREVLAVAQSRAVDHVLTGDKDLLREAARHGLTCLRATDLVVLLKRQGQVTEAKSVLDRMRLHGFGIADATYADALRAAGEPLTP